MTRIGVKAWGFGWLGSLLVAIVPGCSVGEGEACLAYACVNQARLEGVLAVPEETGGVTVKYCSEEACLEGRLDLAEVQSDPRCVRPEQAFGRSEVCFTRDAAGKLQVEAALEREDNEMLPADGERYTLTIGDEASGEVLLEETREADYATTRQDNCHLCWQAEMKL